MNTAADKKNIEKLFEKFSEKSLVGIYMIQDNLFTYVNPKFCEIFKYDLEEVIYKLGPKDITHPDYLEKVNANIRARLEGEEDSIHYEIKAICKDKNEIFVEVFGTRIFTDGKPAILGSLLDITDRKNFEENLIKSEKRYRDFVEFLPQTIFEADADGYLYFVNSEGFKSFRYDEIDIEKKLNILETIVAEDRNAVKENMKRVLNGEKLGGNFYTALRKDGTIFPVIISSSAIYSDNKPVGIRGVIIDNSENVKNQEEINILAHAVKSTGECIAISDVNDILIFINDSMLKTYGYKRNEVIGKSIRIFFPDKLFNSLYEKIKSGWYGELQNIKKDGTEFSVLLSSSVVRDRNSKPYANIFIINDITFRKNSEERLRILSQAVEQSPVSIITTDISGNINYVNPEFTAVTGYTLDEVKGKNPRILSSGEKPSEEYEELWKTITSGKVWKGEFLNKKKNGELFWEFATISPIKNDEGIITNYLAIKEDVTEKKLADESLKEAKEKAEEMNRLKSIFLANMSHELRTPMIGILGYAESLYNELDKPELKEMAATLLKSGNRLKETLDSILDLSRIESNKLEIKLSRINLSEILTDVLKSFKKAADDKSIKLRIILNDTYVSANLDLRMITQIIENLINNALKFTSFGEITAEVNRKSIGGEEFAELIVSDTGIGIPKESLDKIFEPFRQASEGFARSFEGTGLGLTITKKFVELLGGTITVKSKLRDGSAFTVTFPAAKEIPQHHLIDTENNDIENLPLVLLVENDLPTIGIIKLFVQNICNIHYTRDGKSAVQMAKEKNYDAILMDIDLGFGINGLEAARQIKKLPQYNDTPIIAVTAYAMAGDKERFLAEGCTHYLAKPFDKKTLLSLLEILFKK